MENTKERRNITIALYDFRAEKKGQVSMKKNDLLLVKPSTGKWIFSTNRDESGWVPQTFILILNEVKSEKKARKDHLGTENYSLSFSKGDTIRIYKELSGWGIGQNGTKIGYFPLKYVS